MARPKKDSAIKNSVDKIEDVFNKHASLDKVDDNLKKCLKNFRIRNDKNNAVLLEIEDKNIESLRRRRELQCWNEIKINLCQHTKEEVELEAAKRIYDIGMGRTKEGNIQALMYFLDRSVSQNEHYYYVPPEIIEELKDLDDVQSINNICSKLIYLTIHQEISIKAAEQIISLLEKKIKFLETSLILKDFDDFKKLIQQQGLQGQQYLQVGGGITPGMISIYPK